MRTDCKRDNRKTFLPFASHLGFDLWFAKRGNWILFRHNNSNSHGRVIGGVTCEGIRYIEVCALFGNFDCPCIRWIEPKEVIQCSPQPPAKVMEFITGPWHNPQAIIAQIEHGVS